MKTLKFLAIASILAGALVQQAAAQTHIYITGSTAFRAATIDGIAAITHLPNTASSGGNGFAGGTGNDTAYTNPHPPAGQSATGTRNTSFIWEGGYIFNNGVSGASTFVTVCATFTGSEAGIATCTGSLAIPFLPDGSVGTGNASAYLDVQGATPNLTTSNYTDTNGNPQTGVYDPSVQHIPDMALSDVFKGTTPFNGTLALGTPYNANVTFNAGTNSNVGFVTFKWLASKNFPLGATGAAGVDEGVFGTGYLVSSISVEPNALTACFKTGSIPLSQLTGNNTNPGDQTTQIFATGRNPDSGTRATALADSGYGVNTAVDQYQPTTISAGNVTAHQNYPIETIAGLSTGSVGNSGEASGGTLRGYMALTLSTGGALQDEGADVTAAYYITYLGTGDAGNAAVKGIGAELSYKGVPFSLQAIYQGQYTFWSIEHLYRRTNLAGTALQTYNNLSNNIKATTTANLGKAGISNLDVTNNLFQAKRTTDGGLIQVTFTP